MRYKTAMTTWSEESHDYMHPTTHSVASEDAPFIQSIIYSNAFERLRDIKFLGAIDYFLVPHPNQAPTGRRYSRYQHSLGVARLAGLYSLSRNLATPLRRLAYAAALLHDVGHSPLSHSLEPYFKATFGLDHHGVTKDIILGKSIFGMSLPSVLKQYGVDPDAVVSVLDGIDDPFEGFFSGPINFDTIEGILRTWRYVKATSLGLTPEAVLLAATFRSTADHERIVDDFWTEKQKVYSLIIQSNDGFLADYVCQDIAREFSLKTSKDDFLLTESAFFRKLPQLRDALNSGLPSYIGKSDKYLTLEAPSRTFYVDHAQNFFSRNDRLRYRQSKGNRQIRLACGWRDFSAPNQATLFDLAESEP
jgi:hypothetical protein